MTESAHRKTEPGAFFKEISRYLPQHRPVICNLGTEGHLLLAATNASTRFLIGRDIDPALAESIQLHVLTISAELTLLYPLLVEAKWLADLILINGVDECHWDCRPLAFLAHSDVPAVAEAFQRVSPSSPEDKIDATLANLCIALDRLTYRGEGVLVSDNATLERLLFDRRAPYHALASHVWGRLVSSTAINGSGKDEKTAIYFAREHHSGLPYCGGLSRAHRAGSWVASDCTAHIDAFKIWGEIVRDWQFRSQVPPSPYHLSLRPDGTIQVNLSGCGQGNTRIDTVAARRLLKLRRKRPAQLVIQRSSREMLQSELRLWSVDPALRDAVDQAIREYRNERAPLHPLSAVQRLGYLDEHESIKCTRDLNEHGATFLAERCYPMRITPVRVTKHIQRRNLAQEMEDMELSGDDLGIFVTDENCREVCFMCAPCYARHVGTRFVLLDFGSLTEHFEIPGIPDVATLFPAAFEENIKALTRIEEILVA